MNAQKMVAGINLTEFIEQERLERISHIKEATDALALEGLRVSPAGEVDNKDYIDGKITLNEMKQRVFDRIAAGYYRQLCS